MQKLNLQSLQAADVYQSAQLCHNEKRGYHIMFKIRNPYSGLLERRIIRLNKAKQMLGDEERFQKYVDELIQGINYRLRNGESPYMSEETARGYKSVKVLFDRFLADKSRFVRADTIRSYSSLSTHFLDWLEGTAHNCRCNRFTPSLAVRYAEYVQSQFVRVNARTFNGHIKFCRSVFKWGQKHCYCKENPFENVSLLPKKEKFRDVVSPLQRQQIREYYQKHNPAFLVVVELVFNSFIRPKEISRIQIRNIDLQQQVIHLYPDQTKTHAYRAAILSPELVEILTCELANNYPPDYYLVSDGYRPGKRRMTTRAYGKCWRKMRLQLALPNELQLYSLRDTGIMELLDTELSPREVSEVIGHRDLKSINNYLHHHSLTMIDKMQRNTPKF